MAVHSITHEEDVGYWQNGTEETWAEEMGDMKRMLARWANIPSDEIYGSRGWWSEWAEFSVSHYCSSFQLPS